MNELSNNAADAEIHELFRGFLVTHDPFPLVRYADDHPSCTKLCEHEYPAVHRLCDFWAGERAFRVCRCLSCGERLYVLPQSPTPDSAPGVPYALSGSALLRWAREETEEPHDGPHDWGSHLNDYVNAYPPVEDKRPPDFIVTPAGVAHSVRTHTDDRDA